MKTGLYTLVVGMLTWAAGVLGARPASAQESQPPLAVLSISSIDKVLGTVTHLSTAAGSPQSGAMVNFMVAAYLEGLDRAKPVGLQFNLVNGEPAAVLFVAVTDYDAIVRRVEQQLAEPEDAGGGVKRLTLENLPQPIFFTHRDGWLYISNAAANLSNLPADPTTVLGDLPMRYDVAIAANMRQVPAELREMAAGEIRKGFDAAVSREGNNDLRAQQEKLGRHTIENLIKFLEQSERLSIGWGVDQAAELTFLEFSVTALAGSELATQFQGYQKTTTNFAGFDLEDSVATLQFSGPVLAEDAAPVKELLNVARNAAFEQIDGENKLKTDDLKKQAKETVGGLLDVLAQTLDAGKLDGGAALKLAPGDLRFVAGGFVADGAAVESRLKEVMKISRSVNQDIPADAVKFNVAKHAGVNLHQLVVPLPADENEARKVLGDQLEITIGTGPKAIYVAAGKDGVGLIKQVIDSSAAQPNKETLPSQFKVAVAPILRFAAGIANDQVLNGVVANLQKFDGRDQIQALAKPIERGVFYRLEVQDGVLGIVGEVAKQRNGGNRQPF